LPITALLLAALAAPAPALQGDPSITLNIREIPYPGAEWEHHPSPEAAGYSAAALERVRAHLATMHSTGLMAIVGGKVVFQYGNVDTVSYLASVRKSVLSMLFGIYVERGIIDLDRTLAELGIDDNQGLSDAEKQAKVRHVLAARSGVYHPASNSGDDLASAPPRGSQAPGSYYLYSNWDFNVLGTIFEQFTGEDLYDILQRELVGPIGMRDFNREIHRRTGNPWASRHLAYHMHFSTRDMARIGYLMLREGNWNGRQVVPVDWVRESTRAITPVHDMNPERHRAGPWGYGYLWWVWDGPDTSPEYKGAYLGRGAVGQHIAVLPALDLVVVHKTVPGQGRAVTHGQFGEVLRMIVEARVR
jgi:CubicO group peptidase (beta-lactamase class C family)